MTTRASRYWKMGFTSCSRRSPIRPGWTGLPVSCAPRSRVGATQTAPEHQAETVAIVLRNASPGMTDAPHQQRMLREVARLIPGTRHGLGYLEPADYQRTVDVLLSDKTNPVIRQKPDGAWTHDV